MLNQENARRKQKHRKQTSIHETQSFVDDGSDRAAKRKPREAELGKHKWLSVHFPVQCFEEGKLSSPSKRQIPVCASADANNKLANINNFIINITLSLSFQCIR